MILQILAILLPTAIACSCIATSFQTRYCQSAISVKATVLAWTDNCPGVCDAIEDQAEGRITYILRSDAVFKGTRPEDDVMYVETAVNSGLCGVQLEVGSTYLLNLAESMTNHAQCPKVFWTVGLCDFPVAWEDLTESESRFVRDNALSGQENCADAMPSAESEVLDFKAPLGVELTDANVTLSVKLTSMPV